MTSSSTQSPARQATASLKATALLTSPQEASSGQGEPGKLQPADNGAGGSRKPFHHYAWEAALLEVERKCSQPKELKHEFWRVQWKAGSNRKCTIAELPQCGPLNRYYDSIPFDFNRVILFREEEQETGYINASHLESPEEDNPDWNYIVSQGPMSNTIISFWEMIWMMKSPLIIMVTALQETDIEGRIRDKSERYWPKSVSEMAVYLRNLVTLTEEVQFAPDIVKRTFKVVNIYADDSPHMVEHYQYTGWTDVDLPEDTTAVRKLLKILDHSGCARKEPKRPAVIHCNSGIGRSMAFVAIHIALDKLRNLKPSNREGGREAVDMYSGLIALRKLRNSAVHSDQLLSFIYETLKDELQEMLQ